MGEILFIVLVLAGLGAFFFRQPLRRARRLYAAAPVETVIEPVAQPACRATAEPTAESVAAVAGEPTEPTEPTEPPPVPAPPERAAVESPSVQQTLAWRLVQRISQKPGLRQTELYRQFPRENRKNLQAALLQLDREGAIRRQKEGSSYRLFVR